MKIDVLFAVIAFREAEFYANVADCLKKERGLTSAFLTFYEPADRYLQNRDYTVFSLHKNIDLKRAVISEAGLNYIKTKYSIQDFGQLFFHEKHTFCRFNETKLQKKLFAYDAYIEKLLTENNIRNICQELGGFVAPLVLYCNARYKSINHIFFEPSFFKGHLFFNRNTLDVDLNHSSEIAEDDGETVRNYIAEYNLNKFVVVPQKDAHHFKDANLGKIVNRRNIDKLFKKLFYKYIKREKEEYDAIFNHMRQHVLRIFRRKALSKYYSAPDYSQKFIYFPLHVPIDFALTVRQNHLGDQLVLLERIAEEIPDDYCLYIKEHPASIGAYDVNKLKCLKKRHGVRIIHPSINSYDLIANAQYVLTINSKVGVEALMQGKPVLALGKSYYSGAKGVSLIDAANNLDGVFKNRISPGIDYEFFIKIYKNSFAGELYNNSEDNIKKFAQSLSCITKEGHIDECSFHQSTV